MKVLKDTSTPWSLRVAFKKEGRIKDWLRKAIAEKSHWQQTGTTPNVTGSSSNWTKITPNGNWRMSKVVKMWVNKVFYLFKISLKLFKPIYIYI